MVRLVRATGLCGPCRHSEADHLPLPCTLFMTAGDTRRAIVLATPRRLVKRAVSIVCIYICGMSVLCPRRA